jgi:hypothetical protein
MFVYVDPLSFLLPVDDRAETLLRSADVLGLDAYPVMGKRVLGLDFYLNWSGWAWERTLKRYAHLAAERGKPIWIVEAQAEPWEPGLVVHTAVVLDGEVTLGTLAQGFVDLERRHSISRSHTATHMVHKAFREALGETATQAGSENSPGRFRFDFSATGSVPESVMADVEARVNDVVLDDLAVHAEYMSQAEAVKSGAMALFGEKYGDTVRVISVGDWARELCGGTHTPSAPDSSASSSCWGSPRSAPGCAASRRWWAATPTGSSPAST